MKADETPALTEGERIYAELKTSGTDRTLITLRIQNLLFYVNHPEVFERIKNQKVEIVEETV
jgi:hypothetical protein